MKVFLSYAARDRSFARRLRRDLTALGVDPWMDEKDIVPGGAFVRILHSGIDSSDVVLVLLSKASLQSGWVELEWSSAILRQVKEQSIRLIPLLIESVALPGFLQVLNYVDMRRSYPVGLARLCRALANSGAEEREFEVFADEPALARKYDMRTLLSQQGQTIDIVGFTHGGTLFAYDDVEIAKWVAASARFSLFMAKPEHANEEERIERIKHYKKRFSYHQVDSAQARCKNVWELLRKGERKKFEVYLITIPRVNILSLRRIGRTMICRLTGFAQMGTVSPCIVVRDDTPVGKFLNTYVSNLRQHTEFYQRLY